MQCYPIRTTKLCSDNNNLNEIYPSLDPPTQLVPKMLSRAQVWSKRGTWKNGNALGLEVVTSNICIMRTSINLLECIKLFMVWIALRDFPWHWLCIGALASMKISGVIQRNETPAHCIVPILTLPITWRMKRSRPSEGTRDPGPSALLRQNLYSSVNSQNSIVFQSNLDKLRPNLTVSLSNWC